MGAGPDLTLDPNTPKVVILGYKFCLTSVSSMCAEGATYPIDFTKTRLQLQGEAGFTGTKFSFFGMMQNIVKTEGMGGLYSGFTPALARHIPYTGFRAIGYEVRARALAPSFRRAPPPAPAPRRRAQHALQSLAPRPLPRPRSTSAPSSAARTWSTRHSTPRRWRA
jgi:hypothetical protein